jgi:hypothetical protein
MFSVALMIAVCLTATVVASRSAIPVVGVFCADNGTFSGLSEIAFISQNVLSQVAVTGVDGACQSAFMGTLQLRNGSVANVVLATTGIGAVSAALCTSALLRLSSLQFLEIIFVGTSGFSPVLGGFEPTAPGGCHAQSRPTTIAVGSVCVTSTAIDGSCGECISNPYADGSDLPNECARPNCANHTSTSLFGTCSESFPNGLAASIVASNNGTTFPVQPSVVAAGSASWWGSHEAVDAYTRQHPPLIPTLHTNCAEVDAHQIWVGAPLDYLCREYTAELLGLTPASALCMVAMESTGFLQAVRQSQQKSVKVAIVRAASNWDMLPLSAAPSGNSTFSLRWLQNTTYVSSDERLNFVKASYQYAVLTSNNVVLNYISTL